MYSYTHIHMSEYLGFYKLHWLTFFCISPRGHHMHSKYLFIPAYAYVRIHLDFMNYIHNHSSISLQQGSKGTVNIYSYPHTLATCYEELTHWKNPWCCEGRRWSGWQRTRWLDVITDLMDMSFSKLEERWWIGKPVVLQSMGLQTVRHTEWLNLTDIYIWQNTSGFYKLHS